MDMPDPAALADNGQVFAPPRRISLNATDPDTFRGDMRRYFLATFDCYESLFRTLACDAGWFEKSIPLRHPLIFYYGHTATFFVNKMLLTRLVDQRINAHFESVFAVGVDEMSWDDLDDTHYDWPSVQEVQHYRDQVRACVLERIDNAPLTLPVGWDNPWWAIIMGVEHERIHLETSSVLIRQQRLDYVQPQPDWPICEDSGPAPENSTVAVAAGRVALGKARDCQRYGWDNEYGRHEADVPAFKAARLQVSNGEFLAFVEAGGYKNDRWWDEEGRKWKAFAKAAYPTFWRRDGDHWRLRAMAQEIPMPWNWPVEVNNLEARAFCNWKAAQSGEPVRLPTEDEWHRILATSGWSLPDMQRVPANLYLKRWASPCPVDHFRHGPFCDVVGNVWQWTQTPTYPFEGFQTHPIYDDFTTPTFDGLHDIIKGGSWIACGNEAEPESRYAFRRHFFQHAGFRYVISDTQPAPPPSRYETDALVTQYIEFHFGPEYFGVPNFPKALAELGIRMLGDAPHRKALDLGCAVGRSSFELARHFDHVTGVDFSARLIDQPVALARDGSLRYTIVDEGELVEYKTVEMKALGLADTVGKVDFSQGDACNLKPQFTGYDFILAANLIDRLYDPAKFLAMIHERLNVGGLLMITSPYTWLEEHTPREKWLGGFKKDAESYFTRDALRDQLSAHFEPAGKPQEVPFVIRETRHKFQHSLSEATFWRRVK